MNDEHPGTEELERRLEAYASARLTPRRVAIARMRTSLIEEVRMRSLNASISKDRRTGRGRRRVAALCLAATLGFASAVSITAASEAGGPLYGARIWLDVATLATDPDQRALERLHLINARILEMEQAAASGDKNAVAAAIAAYQEAVLASLVEAGTDEMQLADLKSDLGVHLTVLETLAGRVPERAVAGINKAIEASTKAVERIDATKKGNGQGPGGPAESPPGPRASAHPRETGGAASLSGPVESGNQDE